MKRKKIFFEKAAFIHYPLLLWYLWRGYEVLLFDFNYDLKKSRLLRNLINREKIQRIYIKPNVKEHGLAIDQTEIIYKRLKNKKMAQILSDLYETKETNLAFKKALLSEIFKCIYMNEYLSNEKKKHKNLTEIFFVPYDYNLYEKMIADYGNLSLSPLDRIRSYKWHLYVLPFIKMGHMLMWRAIAFFYLFPKIALLFLARFIGVNASPIKPRFRYAIPIDQAFQVKFQGKRSFDFLLDNKEINKKNTIFIINFQVDKNFLSVSQAMGYQFLNTRTVFSIHHIKKLHSSSKFLIHTFWSFVRIVFAGSSQLPFLICAVYGMNIFLKWNAVFAQISAENYIYTNQEGFTQILINLLVKGQGGRTWNYSSFLGGGILYAVDNNFKNIRHILWAYLNSDHFLAVNEEVIKYHKIHYQAVKEYHSIGSIYSEMVRDCMREIDRDQFVNRFFGQDVGKETKILSFFDTTFVDSEEAVTTFEDAIDFYQDIMKLINDIKHTLVIIKASKDEDYFVSPHGQWSSLKKGDHIIALWNDLRSRPNVFWAGHTGDVPAIIAVSDVVITHCMSSPTAEALGAKKKAIWYESGKKHRDLAYDRIPGLLIHSYNDLKERIKYLLYALPEDEYEEYLSQNIEGKVESRLDGLALTRFRELITAQRV